MPTHSLPPPLHQRGFSLVELIVTIAILAILANIAAPAMQNMIIQSRLTSHVNDLVSAVQFARGEAIKRNQVIRLCRTANASATSCTTTAGNWEHWVVLNANNTALRRGSLPDNLRLSGTLNKNTLTFAPTGLNDVTADKDSLVLCSPTGDGDTRRTLQIRLAGGIALSKSSGCS